MGADRIWGDPGFSPNLLAPAEEAAWRLGRPFTFALVAQVPGLTVSPYRPGDQPAAVVRVRGSVLDLAWSGQTSQFERASWGGRQDNTPAHGPLLVLPKQAAAAFESGHSGVRTILFNGGAHCDVFLWEDMRIWLLQAVHNRTRKRAASVPSPERPPMRNPKLTVKPAPHPLGEVFPWRVPVVAGPF